MIPSLYFWENIFLLAIGTLFIRSSIILISEKVKITPRVREVFSFIPSAILPAFIAPAVFFHQGTASWALGKERFFILLAATAVCYLTRSTLATIGFGLVVLYCATQMYI
ncbi:MAG: AzlD domain-containing protein [Bdellovibrionales bacterium]